MRSKKALYNISTQLVCDVVTIINTLIIPRLILSTFGSEYNGIISSITQFLEYISLLTLGVSGSTRVAIYRAKGDIEKISRVLKATEKFMRRVAFVFVFYLLALAFVYPLVVHSEIANLEISLLVLVIGLGVFFEYFFGVTYAAFISATQSKYINNIILIILRIVSTIVLMIMINAGGNIIFVKLVGAIFLALGPIILNIVVNKKFNIIKKIEPDESALSQRKDVMAHSIANSVHQYTDVFLLSIFSTAKMVSVYSVYYLILNAIKKIELLFTNGLEGAFGEIWAKGEKEKFQKNFNVFEYLIYSLVSVVFTCCYLLIIPFIKLYTAEVTDINYVIPVFAYLSVLAYAVYCLRTPYVVCVQSAGKYKETKVGAFIEAGINLLVSLVLVFPLGITGVTIGTLVANIFRTIQYEIFASKNLLNRSNMIFVKRIAWLASCFIITVATIKLLPGMEIGSWLQWLITGACYFGISFIITMIMSYIFYRGELLESVNIVKRMFKKKEKVSNECNRVC